MDRNARPARRRSSSRSSVASTSSLGKLSVTCTELPVCFGRDRRTMRCRDARFCRLASRGASSSRLELHGEILSSWTAEDSTTTWIDWGHGNRLSFRRWANARRRGGLFELDKCQLCVALWHDADIVAVWALRHLAAPGRSRCHVCVLKPAERSACLGGNKNPCRASDLAAQPLTPRGRFWNRGLS